MSVEESVEDISEMVIMSGVYEVITVGQTSYVIFRLGGMDFCGGIVGPTPSYVKRTTSIR